MKTTTPTRQTAIVTGGGRGIGLAIAEALNNQGHAVAILDKHTEGAIELAARQELRGKRPIVGVACDITQSEELNEAVRRVERELGQVLVLVNNAGIGGPFQKLHEFSDAEFEAILAVNVRANFQLCRLLLPAMQRAGFGRILNIASILGLVGARLSSVYSLTKHALIGLTKSLAAEYGPDGITANAICPGYVATAMGAQEGEIADHLKKIQHRTPVGRLAGPQEIARVAAFLVSEDSGYLNGCTWTADGGLTADLGIT